jgi:hypothetical protein
MRFTGRQDVNVELVALWVSHETPSKAFEFPGAAGFEPPAAERFDLRGGVVEVVHD